MKIGLAQLPVLVPEWFFGNFRYENFPIPEPRIFKLEKYKVVNALVSNKIYHYCHSDDKEESQLCKGPSQISNVLNN